MAILSVQLILVAKRLALRRGLLEHGVLEEVVVGPLRALAVLLLEDVQGQLSIGREWALTAGVAGYDFGSGLEMFRITTSFRDASE